MGKQKYTRMYLLGLCTFICVGYSYAAQNATVLQYLTNLRSTDSGQVGYILGEIFYSGGTNEGKIKQEYLDLPVGLVVNNATTSVTGIVMLEHSTGSTLQTKAPTSGIIKLMWDYFVANKQDKVIGGATTIMTGDLVASRVLVSDTNGKVGASTVTSAELWYLTGVTSNVQSQLNGKAPLASPALSGTPTAPTAAVGTNNTQIATTAFVKSQGYITAASLTGVSSVNSRTGSVVLTSTDVGLGNVNNTSDLNKPISTATQTALNGKVTSNVAIIAGTYPKITYDAKGLVTGGASLIAGDIPSLDWSKITTGKPTTIAGYGITDGVTTTQLNLKADLASPALSGTPTAPTAAVGTNNTQIATTAFVKSQSYLTSSSFTGVSSVNSRTGAVTLTSSDVGLGNVNNTSDATKNVLSATKLTTARNIAGVSFNGTADINIPLLSGLGNYVWTGGMLPATYPLGIQTSFVQGSDGFQSYGSVMNLKGYNGGGGTLQLYTPYSPTYGGTGLQVRFGNYDVNTGNSWTGWKTLLASDNYNDYTPTKTGIGASGTWGINITGSAPWSGITGKPTTLAGYGITDAASDSETVKLTGNQTVAGIKTFSNEVITNSANGFRIGYGSYGAFLRNDGSSFYLLYTASGSQNGTRNGLRPFISNIVTGDVGLGNNALYVEHGGNVGIGTTNPINTLEVSKDQNGNTALAVFNRHATATGATAYLYAGNDKSGISIGIMGSANTNTGFGNPGDSFIYNAQGSAIGKNLNIINNQSGKIQFYTDSTAAGVQRMVIDNIGNVGIGTPTPTNKFTLTAMGDVTGADAGGGMLLQDNDIVGSGSKLRFDVNELQAATNGLASTYAINPFGGDVRFGMSGTGVMIKSSGYVGIGTVTPAYKLDVLGDVNMTGMLGIGTAVPTFGIGVNIGLASSNGSYKGVNNLISTSGTFTANRANYGINTIVTNSANQSTYTHTIYGDYTNIDNNSTSVTAGPNNFYAQYGLVDNITTGNINSGVGIYGHVINRSTGDFSSSHGVYGYTNNAGAGTISSAFGVRGHVTNNGGGIISTAHGGYFQVLNTSGTTTTGYGIYIDDIQATTDYGIFQTGTNDVNYFAGNTGIGTSNPGTYKLYVNGTGYLGAAAWVYSSDRRLKENISSLSYGLEDIMKLKTKKFDYIKGEKNNFGFIAQDVQKIFPEIVNTQPNGMLGLKTDMIVPVLVNAVQELKKEIKDQDNKINDLEKQIKNIIQSNK